jgi:hypothetical protein
MVLGLRSLLVIAAAVLTGTSAAADAASCRVRIEVMDNYGKPVEASRMSMTVGGSSVPVEQNKAFPVPCGHYTLTVFIPGFDTEAQVGDIDQLEQVIAVAMRVGAVDGPVPSCAIFAQVTGQTQVQRVRLVQLFGRYMVDVPLSAAKTADFRSLSCGDYMLVAMGAAGCLGTKIVRAAMVGTRVDLAVNDQVLSGCTTLEVRGHDGPR